MAFSTPLYGQGGSYTAAQDRRGIFGAVSTYGVVQIPTATTGDLAVTTTGTSPATVNVAVGDVWIPEPSTSSPTGLYYVYNDTQAQITGFTNTTTNPRIDLIVLTVTDSGSGNPTAALAIVTGTAAASPVAPAVPSKSVPLAKIAIPASFTASTTAITAGWITDIRPKAKMVDISVSSIANNVTTARTGNLAYDSGYVKYYDGAAWKSLITGTDVNSNVSGLTNANTAAAYRMPFAGTVAGGGPSTPSEGDLWYQTDVDRIVSYDGSAWRRAAYSLPGGRTGFTGRQTVGWYLNTAHGGYFTFDTRDTDTDAFTIASTTSASSVTIGTGSKTFTVGSGLGIQPGISVLIYNTSNTSQNMTGLVTSYSGTTLVVNVTDTANSGTFSTWTLNFGGIYVPTGLDGLYGVSFYLYQGAASLSVEGAILHTPASPAGYIYPYFTAQPVGTTAAWPTGTNGYALGVSATLQLSAGDIVNFFTYQTTGAAQNVYGRVTCYRLGA